MNDELWCEKFDKILDLSLGFQLLFPLSLLSCLSIYPTCVRILRSVTLLPLSPWTFIPLPAACAIQRKSLESSRHPTSPPPPPRTPLASHWMLGACYAIGICPKIDRKIDHLRINFTLSPDDFLSSTYKIPNHLSVAVLARCCVIKSYRKSNATRKKSHTAGRL